jgi:hypothetical protein
MMVRGKSLVEGQEARGIPPLEGRLYVQGLASTNGISQEIFSETPLDNLDETRVVRVSARYSLIPKMKQYEVYRCIRF